MARVLISHYSGVYDRKWELTCFYEGLISSLVRNGNQILHLISNDFIVAPWAGKENVYISGINKNEVRTKIKSFSPDIVICFNNSTIPELDTILECPIFIWDADAPFYFCDLENMRAKNGRYHFLAFSKSGVDDYKNFLNAKNNQITFLPSATDVRNISLKKERNIVFIGTNFRSTESFKNKILEDSQLRKKCLNAFTQNQNNFQGLISQSEIFPPDVIQALSMLQSGNNRVKVLDAISEFGLEIYGTSSWIKLLDFSAMVALSYNEQKVYSLEHNQNLYNSSFVGLSISHNQSKTGFPWRVYDIMASDCCLLSDYKQDLKDETNSFDLPLYKTIEEAKKYCEILMTNESLRVDLIKKSNEYIENNCRFEHRFKILEDLSGCHLLDNTEEGSYLRLLPENKFSSSVSSAVSLFSRFLTYEQMKAFNRIFLKKLGINVPSALVKKIQKSKNQID